MSNELSTSVLSLFDTTKAERQSFCIDLVSKLEAGTIDPLKCHLQVKSMEDLLKQLKENSVYSKYVLEAAQQYGTKSFEFGNAKVEIKEAGTKYDYSQCEDSVLADLQRGYDALGEALKARQKFLQQIPIEGMTLVTSEGEAITCFPPSKSSSTIVSITLK